MILATGFARTPIHLKGECRKRHSARNRKQDLALFRWERSRFRIGCADEFLTKNYLDLTLRLSVCSFILLRPKQAVGVARIRLQSLGARLPVIQRQTRTASDRESRQHGVWGRVFRAFDAPSVKHRQSEILSGTLRGL
jgi:hypothetical protein